MRIHFATDFSIWFKIKHTVIGWFTSQPKISDEYKKLVKEAMK